MKCMYMKNISTMQIYTYYTYTLYMVPVPDCKLQPLHNDCSSTIFFQSKIRKSPPSTGAERFVCLHLLEHRKPNFPMHVISP